MLLTDLAVDDELAAAFALDTFTIQQQDVPPASQEERGNCSASRPRRNPPCREAVGGLAEGYNNDGKIDEPGASVRNGVEKDETTFKKDKTTTQLKHLEPRAHEKNCVWHVLNARGAVCCVHRRSHSKTLKSRPRTPSHPRQLPVLHGQLSLPSRGEGAILFER